MAEKMPISSDSSALVCDLVPVELQTNNNNKVANETTKDRYNIVFIMFYVMGTIASVPSNFFITASNFWNYKFRNLTGDETKSKMQTEFFSTFGTVSTCATVAILGVAVILANRISIHVRMLSSMSIMLCLFTATLFLIVADTDSWQKELYVISMVIGGVLNAAGACFYVPVFQLASKFPPTYLAAQMTGSSLCGVLASVVQIMSIGVISSPIGSGFLYFAVGGVIVGFAMALYVGISWKCKYFIERYNAEQEEEIEATEGNKEKAFSKELFITVFRKNGIVLLSLVSVMGASTMIHPGVTSLISSTNKGNEWSDVYFVPVCCYFFYHLFELIGKELVRRYPLKISQWCLLSIGLSRMLILIPLILFCNIQPRKHTTVLLNSDYAFIFLMILLAISSGYLTNLCIFSLPSLADPKEMKLSFLLILVFMIVTLASFSFISILFVKII